LGILNRIRDTAARMDANQKRSTLEQRLRHLRNGKRLGQVGGVVLYHDRVVIGNRPPATIMLTADTTAFVDSAGGISSRVTATRLVGLGVFALAAPKRRDDRELYFYVDDPAGVAMGELSPTQGPVARKLAVMLINAAQNVEAGKAACAKEIADVEAELAALDATKA
jgi:hypothetical protein